MRHYASIKRMSIELKHTFRFSGSNGDNFDGSRGRRGSPSADDGAGGVTDGVTQGVTDSADYSAAGSGTGVRSEPSAGGGQRPLVVVPPEAQQSSSAPKDSGKTVVTRGSLKGRLKGAGEGSTPEGADALEPYRTQKYIDEGEIAGLHGHNLSKPILPPLYVHPRSPSISGGSAGHPGGRQAHGPDQTQGCRCRESFCWGI